MAKKDETKLYEPRRDEDSMPLYAIEAELTETMADWLAVEEAIDELVQWHGVDDFEALLRMAADRHSKPPSLKLSADEHDQIRELAERRDELETQIRLYTQGARDKRDALARYLLHLQSRADALKAEKQRLEKMQKRVNRKLDGLRGYILSVMSFEGVGVLAGSEFELSRTRNAPSVEITDETAVPDLYRKDPVTPPPDKTAIKKALMKAVNDELSRQAELLDADPADAMQAVLDSHPKENWGELVEEVIDGCRLVTDNYSLRVR